MPGKGKTWGTPLKEWTAPTTAAPGVEATPEAPYFVAVEKSGREQRIPAVPIMSGDSVNGQFAPSTAADVQTVRGLALYLNNYGGDGTDLVSHLTKKGMSLDTSLAVCLDITRANLAKATVERDGIQASLNGVTTPNTAAIQQQLNALSVDGLTARHDALTEKNAQLDLSMLSANTDLAQPQVSNTQRSMLERQIEGFNTAIDKNAEEMRDIEAKVGEITAMNTLEAALVTQADAVTTAQSATRAAEAAQNTASAALNTATQRVAELGKKVESSQQELSTQFTALSEDEKALAAGKRTPEEIVLPAIDEVGAPNFAAVKAFIAARNALTDMRKELATLTEVEKPAKQAALSTANMNLQTAQNTELLANEVLVNTQNEYATLTKDGVCAEILKLRSNLATANAGVATASTQQAGLRNSLAEVNARIARLERLETRFEAMSGYEESKQVRNAARRVSVSIPQPTTAPPMPTTSATQPTAMAKMPWLRRAGQWVLERSPTLRTWWAGVMPPAPAVTSTTASRPIAPRTAQPSSASTSNVALNPLWFDKLERYFSDVPSARNYLTTIADGGALTGIGFKNADELNAALSSKNLTVAQSLELYKYVTIEYRNRNSSVDGLPTEDEIKAISTPEQAAHVNRLCTAAVSRSFGVDGIEGLTDTEKEAVNSYTKSAGMLLRAELRADELWDSVYEKLYAFAKKNGKANAMPPRIGIRSGSGAGIEPASAPQSTSGTGQEGMVGGTQTPADAGLQMIN